MARCWWCHKTIDKRKKRHPDMDQFGHSPPIEHQLRYLLTCVGCSLAPVVIVALLPDPLHASLVPLAALFGAYAFMFGIALLLYGMEVLWRLLRPKRDAPLRCPVCHTIEQPYRRFFADRIAPALIRAHCPECHERWIARG